MFEGHTPPWLTATVADYPLLGELEREGGGKGGGGRREGRGKRSVYVHAERH